MVFSSSLVRANHCLEEVKKAESEAIGRHFGLTWFEKVDDLPDGVLVRRTAREGQHMDLMLRRAGCPQSQSTPLPAE